jgi:hypothetical protein
MPNKALQRIRQSRAVVLFRYVNFKEIGALTYGEYIFFIAG